MLLKDCSHDPETLTTYRNLLFRSVTYAFAAYFISILFERILIIAGAILRGYSFELNYNKVNIVAERYIWDQEAVLLIYLAPFLVQAVVVILLYLKFNKIALKPHYSRIFMLWIILFITYRLLGMFPSQMIFKTGIYHAFNWLYLGLFFKVFSMAIALTIFFLAGFNVFKGILLFAGSYNSHVRDMGVPNLIMASIVYPALAVSLLAFLFYIPGFAVEETSGMLAMILLSIILFIRMNRIDPDIFSFKVDPQQKVNPVKPFILIIIAIIALRIILGLGIIKG
jgi:hypothetical protein